MKLIGSDGKEYPIKLLSARAKKAVLRPLTAELGYLAIAWNQLHHNLSSLFGLLIRSSDQFVANAIWYSTDSDFAQRKMLRAVLQLDDQMPNIGRRLPPLQRGEILWILDQIDNSLRHKRNDALHSPLVLMHGVTDGSAKRWIEAHFNPQNPRARPLRGKDLVEEYKEYAGLAETLSDYASRISRSITYPDKSPWPERPPLPQAHKKKRKTRRARELRPPHPPEA